MTMPITLDAAPARCLSLRQGPHQLVLAPAAGGRILRWTSLLEDGPRDWLTPITASAWPAPEWPKGGLFPLIPFSNRIRQARMRWDGRDIAIQPLPGQAHALHGQAQRMTWEVLRQQAGQVALGLRHPAGDDGWPWAWSARQTIRLSADGRLDIRLSLRNQDTRPMPAGLGLHPYFTADRVQAHARTDWAHEQELARFPRPNTCAQWRRDDGTWTVYLSDWDGQAHIHWPSGPGLRMRAHGALRHLVLHCNAGRYLCVEPATHVCDAVNLAAAGVPGTGLHSLAPGATLSVGITLTIEKAS
ncbi:aldose epimerase [Castellaniella hirudinis]|uniref:aldose epimerase family protein n=1 Tax=Castellaniella hirudinis TaxID=1144617 RepID=UPI0039C031DF